MMEEYFPSRPWRGAWRAEFTFGAIHHASSGGQSTIHIRIHVRRSHAEAKITSVFLSIRLRSQPHVAGEGG